MTLGSLLLAYDRRKDNLERQDLEAWRRTRWLGFVMVCLMGDPKSAPATPEGLLQLRGDEPENSPINGSPEEQRAFFEDLRAQGWAI